MKKHIWISIIFSVLLLNSVYGQHCDINDGNSHIIDYSISVSTRIDYNTPTARTNVTLTTGGYIGGHLESWGQSQVRVEDGWINSTLVSYNDSILTIQGGVMNSDVKAYDDSTVYIYNGDIHNGIDVYDNALVNVYGGTIGYCIHNYNKLYFSGGMLNNDLETLEKGKSIISGGIITGKIIAYSNADVVISGGNLMSEIWAGGCDTTNTHSSIITIQGNEFSVNGISLTEGSLRNYTDVIIDSNYYNIPYRTGILSGTLSDGTSINQRFYIWGNSDIYVTPEPTTLSLLTVGIVAALRRKKQ